VKHSFLDRYARQDTPVHRLDGRVKVIVFFTLIVVAVTTPLSAWQSFVGYALLLGAVLWVGRIPPAFVFTRWLLALPFILLVAFVPFVTEGRTLWSAEVLGLTVRATDRGLVTAGTVAVRATISIVAIITLTSITPFPDLLGSLRKLKVPAVFVLLASFAYRYLFLLVEEAQRMKRARDSRSFGGGFFWHTRVLGKMVGNLFVRSYARAERVYAAMLSRGYDGCGAEPGRVARAFGVQEAAFLTLGLLLIGAVRCVKLWLPQTP